MIKKRCDGSNRPRRAAKCNKIRRDCLVLIKRSIAPKELREVSHVGDEVRIVILSCGITRFYCKAVV